MSTLKTTFIQHPNSESPQILLSASGITFSASVFQATGGTLNLPSITTIAGNEIATTTFSVAAALSASANADIRALSYANSASVNADARALIYATSASANANIRSLGKSFSFFMAGL